MILKKKHTPKWHNLINKAIKKGELKKEWKDVQIVKFGLNASTTAMCVEQHNEKLHESAVVEVKNVCWFLITEPIPAFMEEVAEKIGYTKLPDKIIPTIEQLFWDVADQNNVEIKGMVVLRGTLQIQMTRNQIVDKMVRFVSELISGTHHDVGSENFATAAQPYVNMKPSIFTGKGKFEIDPEHFSPKQFKRFVETHGIQVNALDVKKAEFKVGLTNSVLSKVARTVVVQHLHFYFR